MVPKMLEMLGLNGKTDMKMAENIWKMLDEMAENDPSKYKDFIKQNVNEGISNIKTKQKEQQKKH